MMYFVDRNFSEIIFTIVSSINNKRVNFWLMMKLTK